MNFIKKLTKKINLFVLVLIFLPLTSLAGKYQYHLPGYKADMALQDYMSFLYKFLLGVAGLLAMVVLVVGGIEYATAAGNVNREKSAKERMQNAILGLAIILTAYLILWTINPDLVRVKLPSLSFSP